MIVKQQNTLKHILKHITQHTHVNLVHERMSKTKTSK